MSSIQPVATDRLQFLARYDALGTAGLVDQSRRPHRSPAALDPVLLQRLLEAHDRHPYWGRGSCSASSASAGLTMYFEVLARAALGQVAAVHSLLDEALELPPQPIWTYGAAAAGAALELRAHGGPDSAHRVMKRAIDWYRARLGEGPERVDTRFKLARCLYWADRWSEARELLSRLVAVWDCSRKTGRPG